ncbi:MAG: serine/threonine-protein kinase, partial [Myxococcota bacterium]|nr:serine/threonine-protein kinase [Myxococcota bacterium]
MSAISSVYYTLLEMGANPTDPEVDAQDVSVDATGTTPSDDMAATLIAPDGGTATSGSGLQAGAVLAETYEVQRLLGEGAFGAVWEATHRRLAGRRVAVKVLHDAVTSEEVLTRFRHEAEAAARIVHPNVVSVLDYNTLPTGQPYIVLEHLQGEPLADRLAPGRLPCEEALRIAEQIGRALHAAHGQGVVHRDLKPDNVFLCDGDGPALVKVVDFGISKVADSQTVKTQDAVVIGTPCYMSPEQARGDSRNVDARSDVFALGAIVYEMLTGVRAFDSEQVVSTLYRIIHEEPPPIIELNDTVPESVIAAVERALAKKPDDRFPDMASFIGALTGASIESTETEADTGEWAGETMAAPASQLDTDLASAPSESRAPSSSSGPWWLWAVGAAGAGALIWTFFAPSAAPPAPPLSPSASIETPAATAG